MKLTHTQARKHFAAALDSAPSGGQNLTLDPDLTEHLSNCAACRAYAEQTAGLDAHLAKNLPNAWQFPRVTNQKIDATIQKVHERSRRTQPMTRQFVWQEIQHAWRWGIGLAGIVCLLGILYAGMRLLPHYSAAPGAEL